MIKLAYMKKSLTTIQLLFKVTLITMMLLASSFGFAEKKLSVTLEQAAEDVRRSENGKVLSATTTYFNGQLSHRIQVLTPSGRVKIVQVPTSGDTVNRSSNLNNYRNDRNPQQEKPSQNNRSNRYQDLNQQNQRSNRIRSKPNYQRPTNRKKTNTDKSGNRK